MRSAAPLLLLCSTATAQDPAGGWMAYAVGAMPSGKERITRLEMKWKVSKDPPRSGSFYSPWFGMDPSDNLNLIQPVNPWGGSSWSAYTEYFQWSPENNKNSKQISVKAGQTLHGSLVYENATDSYNLHQTNLDTGATSKQNVKCQSGKKYTVPYVVYEKLTSCRNYPPDGVVNFYDIKAECDGEDCTSAIKWEAKVKDKNCDMKAHIISPTNISITWDTSAESQYDSYTDAELFDLNFHGWATRLPLRRPASPATHDAERQKLIDETNAKQSEWVAAHNPRFRGAPVGVSKSLCGRLAGEKERIAALVAAGEIERVEEDLSLALPSDFDAADGFPQCAKVINDIRDQSNCGCCWAFSAAEAGSDRLCIATNASSAVPLSAQEMCFCSNFDGCNGGSQVSAWNYIKSTGLVTGSQQQPDDGKTDPFAGGGFCSSFSLPHCHHHGPTGSDPYPAEGATGCPSESSPKCPKKCDSTAKAPHNVFGSDKYKVSGVASYANANAMAQAIMTKGPISVGFSVYSDFENYASGIYHHTGGSMLGGHAVRIVGFGTSKGESKRLYWKVANSWNPYWGEKGYFRIRRGTNEVGIEDEAVASSASAKWTTP